MLRGKSYEEVCKNFKWEIPPTYNIGVDVCDKWARDKYRLALIYVNPKGEEQKYTFWELKNLSNQLANALLANGIQRNDRVGILLPQCPETLISHIAVYKVGALALPLLTLFGPMAIEYRLQDSRAKGIITDKENLSKILELKNRLPDLRMIMVVDPETDEDVLDFWKSIEKGDRRFTPIATRPDDPALIIYTSGTTGPPKGTLHTHQLLLGILPGVEFYHNLFPQKGDLMYSPLDWAYIGGSYDALFPSLHHGIPVLAFRTRKFDPDMTFAMMARHGVTNLMVVPTVLRIMMNSIQDPKARFDLRLRSVTAGGETLGDELYDWSINALGVTLNEQYGQTECDLVVGFCSEVMEIRRGSIGKPVPGHVVDIINDSGDPAQPGELGEIAIKRPDPVMFFEYWNNPQATQKKFRGDWMLTGDFGKKDEDGYFWFTGREDDLIESGGYRIGPGEIEDCLMQNEAVALVCVLGVPDPLKGQIIKAFIVPKKGVVADALLEERIRKHVRHKLEAHAYPREIEFLEKMPMTKTGKILKSELREMHEKKRSVRD
jgi:acetyl-CoA synthetase